MGKGLRVWGGCARTGETLDMKLLLGLALASAGAFLILQSVGCVNGGFIVGAPLAIAGVALMTKERDGRETDEEV